MLQHLIDRPALLAEAREAAKQDDPSTFDGYVWEALRFVPILPYLFRQCASPYTLGKKSPRETTIPAGAYVLPVVLSAMFDPHVFERPDEFIPSRSWAQSFHFGFGSHECLGKYVGMVMIPEMVRQMVLLPNLRAEGSMDYKDGPFPESYPLRWG